ncbi:MAG: Gfo/Idh/MocA family oxidoreductase, partial [Proteobacteria bacterium]|nr:Gfo/Idh/MocA family oxidoreductase [Pseudomonadota bacterium]
MSRRLRAGVVGLGVGEQHLLGYNAIEGVEVTDICDIDPEKLAEVGERNQVSGRHTDYRRVTENPDIDVVSIASHDDHHVEQAISAFRHGKHVMLEKPVALNR